MKNTFYFLRRFLIFLFWTIFVSIVLLYALWIISLHIPKYSQAEKIAELEHIRTELPLAQARWESHNIVDYEIEASAFIHPLICGDYSKDTFSPWQLKIIQDGIVFDNEIQKDSIEACNISDFLPPRVFDTIRQIISKPTGGYLKVEFDPDYGFVSDYFLTAIDQISTLNVRYIFSNFHPK